MAVNKSGDDDCWYQAVSGGRSKKQMGFEYISKIELRDVSN